MTLSTLHSQIQKGHFTLFLTIHNEGCLLSHQLIFILVTNIANNKDPDQTVCCYDISGLEYIWIYLHFLSNPFTNLYIFATVHSLVNYINLKTAKLTCPCNTLPTLNSFARSDTGVVIDNEPHLCRMCKTSLLFAPLAVCVQAGCSAFPFYSPT